jgi:hypothetical protein
MPLRILLISSYFPDFVKDNYEVNNNLMNETAL